MKPIKGLIPFAMWLLRLTIILFVLSVFFETIKTFSFQGIYYFVALIFVIASGLLFAGGFMKQQTMTVFAGLLIFLLSLYIMFDLFDGFTLQMLTSYTPWLMICAGGLLFASAGNKS
jgi:hypothetical protein